LSVRQDARIEEYKQAKKVFTEGKILASGGLQQRSQTAKEYTKALGLKPGKMLKHYYSFF